MIYGIYYKLGGGGGGGGGAFINMDYLKSQHG